jgi:hypothetical protein
LDKQRGVKRARPYKQRFREAVNEDCLNISVNNHTMGQPDPNMYNAIGGDKESSIHMDGGRTELEAFEMSES